VFPSSEVLEQTTEPKQFSFGLSSDLARACFCRSNTLVAEANRPLFVLFDLLAPCDHVSQIFGASIVALGLLLQTAAVGSLLCFVLKEGPLFAGNLGVPGWNPTPPGKATKAASCTF
jgi:hypothetical protein